MGLAVVSGDSAARRRRRRSFTNFTYESPACAPAPRARLVVMQYSLLKREGAARTQRSEAAHGGLLSARMEWDGLQVTLR